AQLIFQTALAMLVAYICTFVRDIDAVMSHLMRLWFYGSPVIWSQDMIPSHYHWILEMNPMAHLLGAYRGILMQGQTPDLAALSGLMRLSASLIVLMTYFYSQHEHRLIKALYRHAVSLMASIPLQPMSDEVSTAQNVLIEAENVGVRYSVSHRDDLQSMTYRTLLRRSGKNEFWALRNLSMTASAGEVI